MEEIHQEILEALRSEFGEDKVRQVEDLGDKITTRMLNGEKVLGVPEWMFEVVDRFHELIISHPQIEIPIH